jgi:aryl-alcohol dehydrogenase-like predicted oxidoreductase
MPPECRSSGSAVGSSVRVTGAGDDYARREAGAIVERALDLGVNLVDTAEIYAYGRSERIVGEAIRGRRDEVFLATKLFPVLPVAPVVEQRAQASARRLGVDAIDLYQVHWPQLRRVLSDIRAWPEDDARYRSLLADLRKLARLLDEKLPPASAPLPPT